MRTGVQSTQGRGVPLELFCRYCGIATVATNNPTTIATLAPHTRAHRIACSTRVYPTHYYRDTTLHYYRDTTIVTRPNSAGRRQSVSHTPECIPHTVVTRPNSAGRRPLHPNSSPPPLPSHSPGGNMQLVCALVIHISATPFNLSPRLLPPHSPGGRTCSWCAPWSSTTPPPLST